MLITIWYGYTISLYPFGYCVIDGCRLSDVQRLGRCEVISTQLFGIEGFVTTVSISYAKP